MNTARLSSRFVTRLMTAAACAAAVPAIALALGTGPVTNALEPIVVPEPFELAAPVSLDQPLFIAGARTRAAFEKGEPLVETEMYKVHASRRNAPGMAEVHTQDTDIIYVLDGTATIVTGGTLVEGTKVAAHEIRGRAIDGGVAQTLAKGDVFIVPNGVPHWFTEVQAPFLYYVVKTTDARGGEGAR